jgi:O-antigen/teichoic acid export membrane protein
MSIKKATEKNVKWSFIESLSLKVIGFILGIILARLLNPSDFGVLAIVNVFYLITTLFIDGGLREALIQKRDASKEDYATMFWLNLGIACFIYLLLFICAPFIESIYKFHNLGFYIRIQSLVLIIESMGFVQIVKATKELNLKKITVARIPATIFSFFVGITLAYLGYGILSLIIQQLVNEVVYLSLLVFNIRYKPDFIFRKSSLKSLYSFGLKMFALSYLNRIYVQSLNLIYAHFYKERELGLYVKSNGLQGVPIELINSAFIKGLYPTMVKVQQHNSLLRKIFLTNVKNLTFLMVLINIFFFYNALEITRFLLGEKWLDMADYMKIASLGSLFLPINTQVISIFKVKGRADFILKLEMIWKSFALLMIIVLSIQTNFFTVLCSMVALSTVMGFVYLYFCSKTLLFSFKSELMQILILFGYFFSLGYLIEKFISNFNINHDLVKLSCFSALYFLVILSFGYINKDFKLSKLLKRD